MVLTPSRSRTYVEASAEAESDRPPPRGRTFARLKSFVMPQGRAKQARFSQVLSRKSRIHRVERATKTHDDEDFATREVDHRRKKKRRPPGGYDQMVFGGFENFPDQQGARCPVFNPEGLVCTVWEGLMLPFVAFAAIVTPTELAFYPDAVPWWPKRDTTSFGWTLFTLNRVVDLYFLLDMGLQFNVAVFDARSGLWVTDRRVISRRYAESWLAIDVLSILPYDALEGLKRYNRFRLLRTLKILKLLKLLRVVRIGRLLNWWAARLQLSFKIMSVLRFVFIIVVVLHWFACAARMLVRPCEPHYDDDADASLCDQNTAIITTRTMAVEYFSALHWSMRALTGDADAPNLGMMVLAIVAGLSGNIVTSFMIGEVAHILGHADPASTEYRNTVDNLNSFAAEKKFPREMRLKLREFFVSASSMFRNVYHRKMLLALSPGLQKTIAKEEIGRYIVKIPFFRYAIFRQLRLQKGERCKVKQAYVSSLFSNQIFLRPARVTRVGADRMSYDVGGRVLFPDASARVEGAVAYTDDYSPEAETALDHERIVCARGTDALLCQREVEMMVRELSLHVSCVSFMANETMVHQGISWNDVLYIMVEGRAVVFDRDDRNLDTKEVCTDRRNNIVGKDVCTLLVDGRRRVRHYTAKTITHSLVYSMTGDQFVEILMSAHYRTLSRGVRAYGLWMLLKYNIKRAWRAGRLQDVLRGAAEPRGQYVGPGLQGDFRAGSPIPEEPEFPRRASGGRGRPPQRSFKSGLADAAAQSAARLRPTNQPPRLFTPPPGVGRSSRGGSRASTPDASLARVAPGGPPRPSRSRGRLAQEEPAKADILVLDADDRSLRWDEATFGDDSVRPPTGHVSPLESPREGFVRARPHAVAQPVSLTEHRHTEARLAARIGRLEAAVGLAVQKMDQLLAIEPSDSRQMHRHSASQGGGALSAEPSFIYEDSSQATSVQHPHPLVDDVYDDDGSSIGPPGPVLSRPQTTAGIATSPTPEQEGWAEGADRRFPPDRRPRSTGGHEGRGRT